MQDLIEAIAFNAKRYQQWLRARTRLTNQQKALRRAVYDLPKGAKLPAIAERDADREAVLALFLLPLQEAERVLDVHIAQVQKTLRTDAERLPVAEWWTSLRGMNLLGLALIVGEAGDLGMYRNPSCVWKRFGLHVLDTGAAPRPKGGETLGYSPRRRSVIKVIGNSIKMGGTKAATVNPYRLLYDARKLVEVAKAPDLKPMQHDLRAMRYMEKRLLRDLWLRWNGREETPASEYAKAA